MVLREKIEQFKKDDETTLYISNCIHEDINCMMVGKYYSLVGCKRMYISKAYFSKPAKSKEKEKSFNGIKVRHSRSDGLNIGDNIVYIQFN